MKPTRILAPPTIEKGQRNVEVLTLHTDAGTMSVSHAAKVTGMQENRLRARLKKIGWDHPAIFSLQNMKRQNTSGWDAPEVPDELQGIYAKLPDKVRDYNLRKLPELTAWDRRCCR